MNGDLTHKETDSIVKDILEKNCIQIGELDLEPSIAKTLSDLLANKWTKSWIVSRYYKPSQQASRSNFSKSTLVLDCVIFDPEHS